jgi:hypothetical protein
MMGPSAIGAQPPPEDYDEEWLMMQEDEEGDEPFCTCSTGHGIEETDWNQCDSCGKPIYDEEPAVSPAPTFCERAVNLAIDTLEQFHKYGYDREQCFDALCDLRTLMTMHNLNYPTPTVA